MSSTDILEIIREGLDLDAKASRPHTEECIKLWDRDRCICHYEGAQTSLERFASKNYAVLCRSYIELSSWQDIDTAPNDGTFILLWNGHWRGVGFYKEPHFEGDPVWFDEATYYITPPPTRWMPLPPAPPTTEQPEAQHA